MLQQLLFKGGIQEEYRRKAKKKRNLKGTVPTLLFEVSEE
jgi:hypothetical protein